MEKEGEQSKDAKAKEKRRKQAQGEKSKNKDERDHQLNRLKKNYLHSMLEDYDEDWIQCSSCHGWAHEAGADIPECLDNYICDRCQMF